MGRRHSTFNASSVFKLKWEICLIYERSMLQKKSDFKLLFITCASFARMSMMTVNITWENHCGYVDKLLIVGQVSFLTLYD
jgi:hypothetical protein